jgi:hypothetical protein
MEWVSANPKIAVALIAAAGAIVGGIIAAAARFLFDFYISERLKRRWQTIETKVESPAWPFRLFGSFEPQLCGAWAIANASVTNRPGAHHRSRG